MGKKHFIALACVLTVLSSADVARAATYICPAPNLVNCVPATKTIDGWTDNGGMKTGNTFAPNSTCANVINLPNGKKRLLCCYSCCGVFYRDVTARTCTKTSESEFNCE